MPAVKLLHQQSESNTKPEFIMGHSLQAVRTIRPSIPPSELVVANALPQSLPEFLLNATPSDTFAKFVIERQDTDKMEAFRLAS
jgi:hypothetical protein